MALHQMKIKFNPKMVDIHRGKQFTQAFLSLNPKGEVPVLVDDIRVIPDSEHIIDYLEDNFSNGNPGLLPRDRDIRTRAEQLHRTIHNVNIEALSFGAAMFDDLGINPKPPYNCLTNCTQMRDYLEKRPKMIREEIERFPMYADALRKKLQEIEDESHLWTVREDYEGLLIHLEKVLDECEAELASHEIPEWWLCSPQLSIADIDLSLLLYRLWQLGFERRMWERQRPFVKRYFARVQRLDTFKKAVTMTEPSRILEFIASPVFLGVLGTTAILAGGFYLWHNRANNMSFTEALHSLLNIFNNNNNKKIEASVSPVVVQPVPVTASNPTGSKGYAYTRSSPRIFR